MILTVTTKLPSEESDWYNNMYDINFELTIVDNYDSYRNNL